MVEDPRFNDLLFADNQFKREIPGLNERELDIVECVIKGGTGEDLARIFKIRPKTVRNNLWQIYGKLGVHDQAQLVIAVYRLGLVEYTPQI